MIKSYVGHLNQLKRFKQLLIFKKSRVHGRNSRGIMVNYHRGGGVRRSFRYVDFIRYVAHVPGLVFLFVYDNQRQNTLSLVLYGNGVISCVLSIVGVVLGDTIQTITDKHLYDKFAVGGQGISGNNVTSLRAGCTYPLKLIRTGSYINQVFTRCSGRSRAIFSRTARGQAKLISTTSTGYSIVKLKSGCLLRLTSACLATFGELGFWAPKHVIKKAGRTRHLGFRPHVRGVAMNPVDHPHGGGQGKTSGGRPSVSPWAVLTKGFKTRRRLVKKIVLN